MSELLSDQAAFITSPKTSLANYWGGHCPPCPPVSTGLIVIQDLSLDNPDKITTSLKQIFCKIFVVKINFSRLLAFLVLIFGAVQPPYNNKFQRTPGMGA